MRSTVSRSLAAVAAGAALTVVPVGVALADGHNPIDVEDPFSVTSLEHDPDYNKAFKWTIWLTEVGFVGVKCWDYQDGTADEIDDKVFTVPADPGEDASWLLAVVKAGSGDEANDLYWEPMPGDELYHSTDKEISHVVLCSAEDEDDETTTTTTTTTTTSTTTTSTSTTTTPSTGPVVETDIPSDGGPSQLGLFAGLATALAAAGGFALNRRRQSAEH